jgi:hypothetical protein
MTGKKHIIILPFVIISLLAGFLTGWIRIGINNFFPFNIPSGEHGAIMACSFLGTLICLEKTAAFPNRLALLIPAVNVLSLVFFLTGQSNAAYIMLVAGAAGLVTIYYLMYIKHKGIYILVMMAGALCYLIGNAILLKTSFYPAAVMWWIAFLFFTIAGERLELSKFVMIKNAFKKQSVLLVLLALFITGIIIPFHSAGGYLLGISLILTAAWLIKYDTPRMLIKGEGQNFYSGLLLLTGYLWLALTGALMIYGAYFGLFYDSSLHAFFLGFVFSMIFAHAPLILPAVLKLKVKPFGSSLYTWFVLLNLSLLVRVFGIYFGIAEFKSETGLVNGIAILGFFINMAVIAIKEKRKGLAVHTTIAVS